MRGAGAGWDAWRETRRRISRIENFVIRKNRNSRNHKNGNWKKETSREDHTSAARLEDMRDKVNRD
jgi:hypothetical protein